MARRNSLITLTLVLCWTCLATPAQAREIAPAWSALTPEQQSILGPAGWDWDQLPAPQRIRLIHALRHYPQLTPAEQARFRTHLSAWTHLPKEQRELARKNYKAFHALPPERRRVLQSHWKSQHPATAQPEAVPTPPVPTIPSLDVKASAPAAHPPVH